ncbi:MAG: hypothetical protein K6F79_09870 [Saccharofermentans sp.]|nr:hypothetical protein [Saccharofermentans sp.]
MEIIKMNCPHCGAPLAFGDSISKVTCEHCGQTFVINDKAAEIDRISAAETEASKRKTEAERKEMELRLEEEKRKNDESIRVQRKKTLSAFLPLIVLLSFSFVLIGILSIKGCIDSNKRQAELAALADKGIENGVNAPDAPYVYNGQNYDAVRLSFEAAGFTNIQTVPMGDLVTGLLNSEGEVDNVTIAGGSFVEGEQFAPDALVVISYHSYPERSSTTESSSAEAVEELYNEASYMATAMGNITYVYPIDWGMTIDGENRATYINPDGTINMVVSSSQTEVSIEDDNFGDYIEVFCGDVISGDYEVSIDQVGGHPAKRIQGEYSGSDNTNADFYMTDYDEGILIVGFLYTADNEDSIGQLERDLLSSFIFAGREEIVYTNANFGNVNYDVPDTWTISEQSSERIVYTSPDGFNMLVSYQTGDFSISDEGFIETVESQLTWDDFTSELVTMDGQDTYYVTGINNNDGGYVCVMYTTDSEPGIVTFTFYYYPEYELLYSPQIEHIISSVDILG